VAPGVRLAYRRNAAGPGSWSVLCADGAGGSWLKKLAVADDTEDADGKVILDFWAAVDGAKKLARADDGGGDGERPSTVREAIEAYRLNLAGRDGDECNATLLLPKLSPALSGKPVSMVTQRDVLAFREKLLAGGVKRTTATRSMSAFLAALRLAARLDRRITNAAEWKLEPLSNDGEARNVILSVDQVRAVVAAAYKVSEAFGLFVELIAQTGTRPSQAIRLTVGDLLTDRVMMPASRKGRNKQSGKTPVPITPGLVAKLRAGALGRPASAPLLLDTQGEAWQSGGQRTPFRVVATAAGLDPVVVTIYALRHSSIVRQLLANVPIRLVAAGHDTSVVMIERTYSRYIAGVGDSLVRGALIEFDAPLSGANVVPLKR
jgi:integrase